MSNGFQKFISGKGFYLALAVCLAGTGAAAWVAVNKTIDNIEQPPLAQTPPAQQEENFLQPAEKKVDNVQKEEDTSSASDKTSDSLSADSSQSDTSEKSSSQADSSSSTDALSPSVQPESSSALPDSSETSAPPAEQQPSAAFSLTLPVNGTFIAPFSGDMLVKNETLNDWRTHNGIDIGAETGCTVFSACDGVVSDVRADPLWGNVVEVTSGEYVLTYAGLSDELMVAEEMPVSAGDIIGSVGEIPCELSLEPHLHFDVKLSGKYVDPASLAE